MLFFGDIIIMGASLFLALWIRYGRVEEVKFDYHLKVFAILFVIWLVVFNLSNLYKLEDIIKVKKLIANLTQAVVISILISVLFFYVVPIFKITPKTILVLFSAFVYIFALLWRVIFAKLVLSNKLRNQVLIVGDDEFNMELVKEIENNQGWGYEVAGILPIKSGESANQKSLFKLKKENFVRKLETHNVSLLAVSFDKVKNNKSILKDLSDSFEAGVSIIDAPVFYENLTGKVPVNALNHIWFLYNFEEAGKRVYEFLKRILDIVFSFLGFLVFLLFIPLVFIGMIVTRDRGGLFYRQKRAGLRGKVFSVVKFRTMRPNKDKQVWSKEDDDRITKLGKFLRKTRIDELPQMINILYGEMSLVGPRPEQPDIVKNLDHDIPFYNRRHIIKPGLTGWAQIQYRYGASTEDAMEKLQYDLYYIKNRSIFLDLAIVMKTIIIVLGFKGR